MCGLHGPNPAPQPIHQREVVGVPAEERLTEMDVSLDQARQNVASARVNDSIVRFFDGGRDRRDTPVTDRDVAVDNLQAVVHGHDDAATYQKGHRECSDLSLEA